jgi:hypothetical protein
MANCREGAAMMHSARSETRGDAMASSITPIRIAPLSERVIRRKRRRRIRMRLGIVACEIVSLAALFAILMLLAGQVRLSSVGRFLAGWPDLSDAHATCRQFVRQAEIGSKVPMTVREVGPWSWLRLEDGRFRVIGTLDHITASGGVRRTGYQCDLALLNTDGRWRLDSLAIREGSAAR